jgi:riboflavin biosynthesis pyrimidine reductase
MKPHIVCHMIVSLDGRILTGRWSQSPDGSRADWSAVYGAIHEQLEVEGWIVGRVSMAEMSRAGPHPPENFAAPERPRHFATRSASTYAIAVDPAGKLHFDGPDIAGDSVVVWLGGDVADAHLAELAADGVSYVVSPTPQVDLAAALEAMHEELGVARLALEGGGGVNAAFFAAGLVDEVSLLVAPALDGSYDSRALVDGVALAGLAQLSLTSCEKLEHGLVHLRYAVSRP